MQGSREDMRRQINALQREKDKWRQREQQLVERVEALEQDKLNMALGNEVIS